MKLTRYHDYLDNKNIIEAIFEFFKDILEGRKYVPSYMVEVKVSFPRNNSGPESKNRDDVTLYTLIMD